MTTTSDPNDPGIGKAKESGQNEAYLVLSDVERAKGFVRPLRKTYVHVGLYPVHPLRDLTAEETERHAGFGYVKFETYPDESPMHGKFWTREQLEKEPCGVATTMATVIAETYARQPDYYGSTFCCGCGTHLPIGEFKWEDGSILGS